MLLQQRNRGEWNPHTQELPGEVGLKSEVYMGKSKDTTTEQGVVKRAVMNIKSGN